MQVTRRKPMPPIHSRFKPGQSGNPGGKPKALLTPTMVEEITQRMLTKSRAQLQDVISDAKSTMLEINIASILIKGAKTGDQTKLESQLQRAVGKVVDKIETNVSPYVIEFRDGSKLALGSSAKDVIEGEVVEEKDDKPVQE